MEITYSNTSRPMRHEPCGECRGCGNGQYNPDTDAVLCENDYAIHAGSDYCEEFTSRNK